MKRVFKGLCSSLLMIGCGAGHFRAPSPEAPHADLLVRVIYHRDFDSEPQQRLTIDGQRAHTPSGILAAAGWARALRLAPGTHELAFSARFEHADLVNEYVRPQLPGCGPGVTTAYVLNDCIDGSYPRPVSSWEWSTDAECATAVELSAQAGEALEVRIHFYGQAGSHHAACEVECVREAGAAPCRATVR